MIFPFVQYSLTMCQIMYKSILRKKGILNKMEYLGPVWLADVWPADDIPFCSIVTYFHAILFPYWKKAHFFSESECYSKSTTT